MVNTFNISCIGASHLKNNIPCQDYSASWKSGKSAIIAVADGHGSEEYIHSDRGARFAVESALICIKELIKKKPDKLFNPDIDLKTLEKSIIAEWYNKVANDTHEEIDDIFVSYGTTLLAAAMTEHYWFAIQIGDGKCVVINDDNSITQPVPWDDKCFLNVTTSLCDHNAHDLFRHYYSEKLPSAVFLGSDGIDDSFPIGKNEEHLAIFYRNVFEKITVDGINKGLDSIKEVLPLLSQKGSGDDVSAAGIIRTFV